LEKDLKNCEEVDISKVKEENVKCQNLGTNAQQLSFNITESFQNARNNIDANKFILIKDKKTIRCPLCSSSYLLESSGSKCDNCNLCSLGEEFIGLKFLNE